MNILVACEESQTVCKVFRAKGHEAFSCVNAGKGVNVNKAAGSCNRSKTFEGIARAMADQWG